MEGKKLAVIVMAYGTDPAGTEVSQMEKDVIWRAWDLVNTHVPEYVIFQGGYHVGNNPTEAELMETYMRSLSPSRVEYEAIREGKSKNTVEGARKILQMFENLDVDRVLIVCQRFHVWRVSYTFSKILGDRGIGVTTFNVNTPFGPNSQRRLTNPILWWPWELLARLVTMAKLLKP